MNLILIAIDTLRADHLGCYGYSRETSPNLDAFAREAVVGEQHIASAIPTHPAFVTINTGQPSITHGVVAHGGHAEIPPGAPWLPRALTDAGYTTCAVDNLSRWRLDFHRGFEFYIDPTQRRTLHVNADSREINRRVLPWLDQHHTERFYLFIHYWDPHTPYLPPRAYRRLFYEGDPCGPAHRGLEGMERHPLGRMWRETWLDKLRPGITDPEYVVALYDGEIRYCDEAVGQLLERVAKLGIEEDTAVLILGDHGEMMYRHGIFFDHHGLYDGNLRVPFLLRAPGLAPRRYRHMTAHQDVAPTLLALAGVEPPEAMQGVELGPWLRGEREDAAHPFLVCQECTWQMKWALRTPTHKLIVAREPDRYGNPARELYDLHTDPGELRNMAEEAPGLAGQLERQLEAWLTGHMAAAGLAEDPLRAHGLTLGKAAEDGNLPCFVPDNLDSEG